MAWQGIWFDPWAIEGGPRSPERFRGLVPPIVYPFAHTFVEEESLRLAAVRDPAIMIRGGERFRVFYSLAHDGSHPGLDQQGCRILRWLFENFLPPEAPPPDPDGLPREGPRPKSPLSLCSRFSEIPVIIHAEDPTRAAALGNALALLRFLSASEDQAIAKILLYPWNPYRGSPALAAEDYEKRVIDFLHGEIFYPEEVGLFDVLERNDLKGHRELEACCLTQVGFVAPLLEWIDECWPQSDEERADLFKKLRNSLRDEARFLRKQGGRGRPGPGSNP